jgi:MerR family transcriptional regulator, light-induced transcriptional regulator
MNKSMDTTTLVSISAVERETGISKDTLRIWERRYGFPQPKRDSNGDRAYALPDVEHLRTIKRLIDRGMRPGKIVTQSANQLAKMSAAHNQQPAANPQHQIEIEQFVAKIKNHQLGELQKTLHQSLQRYGLQSFITDILSPLNAFVGEAWISGELEIFQEHAYTEILQNLLRHAIVSYEKTSQPPILLLATLPKEQHSIGLLMVEAALAVEGAFCVSLGAQLPIAEIVSAAAAHQCNIIALSFTGNYPVKLISEGLINLRHDIPKHVEIWAGGSAIARWHRSVEGVKMLPTLLHAIKEVERWRQQHLKPLAIAS